MDASADTSPARARPRIAYLYSRYPVVSQTFCDSEMLALEARGFDLDIASLNPPPNAFRHERFDQLEAEVLYPPPSRVLAKLKALREADGSWQERFGEMIVRHDREYGSSFKAATRARNALYFAELFRKRGIGHVHVHFANRATHTALFLKQWAGIPFSFTAHAQDFMVDLGSDELLRELCREAEFVVGVSDFSSDLLRQACPDSADKIGRVYNGIAMDQFPTAPIGDFGPLRIISIGRLIEFKGFHHLVGACARLKERGIDFHWTLVGEGPWRDRLEAQAREIGLTSDEVTFAGVQSQESVKQLLTGSDVFCLPCIVDSKGASDILPTVITESMACSLPVVSTRLVGVPEMVVPEETGLLVEPGEVGALADALARLANDRDLARRFGRAGRARAEVVFELQETSSQLAEKFDAALPEMPVTVSPRKDADSVLYLLDTWPPAAGETHLVEEVRFATRQDHTPLSVMACRAGQRPGSEIGDVEFLPDAIVFEAEWQAHPEIARRVMEWRSELGTGIDTEEFLIAARRALSLARLVEKRGIRHLHAARSSVLVTAWLVHRLTGIPFSFTIESRRPFLGVETIDRLAAEASLVSRADSRDESGDRLALRPRDRTRRMEIGPLKLKLGQRPEPPRDPLHERWFRELAEALPRTSGTA